jgi:hypothetical protein
MPLGLDRTAARRSVFDSESLRPSAVSQEGPLWQATRQELDTIGAWASDPIWAPPLDSAETLADEMVKLSKPFTSMEKRWEAVVGKHKSEFTQVREIDLPRASIRLPQGKFFVAVTEQKNFDKITETIPDSVQSRLDEFLYEHGDRPGLRVSYLKPLCVEVGDDLILTSREDLMAVIAKVQNEIFDEYKRRAPFRRTQDVLRTAANYTLAAPRYAMNFYVRQRQQAVAAFQARLEFERRKTAMDAVTMHRRCRTNGCTFDEMLALTNPVQQARVIERYSVDKKLSQAKRDQLLLLAAGSSPWWGTLAMGAWHAYNIYQWSIAITPAVAVCDPAFVAEFPSQPGVLHKIAHFDEVGGVMHIEL